MELFFYFFIIKNGIFYFDKTYAIMNQIKKSAILQTKSEDQTFTAKQKNYQGIIGSIIFLMVEIWLNFVFAILVIS